MSNLRRMLQGGKKPVEKPGTGAPAIGVVSPLHEEPAVDAQTKAHDCAPAARRDADAALDEAETGIFAPRDEAAQPAGPADDERRTTEIALVKPATPAVGKLPPIPKPPPMPQHAAPAAAEEGATDAAPPVTSRPPPPPKRDKTPVPPASAPEESAKPEGKGGDILTQFQTALETALKPIREQLARLETAVAQNDEMISDVVEAVDGEDPKTSLTGIVTALSETVATLQRQLFGEKPDEALEVFGGDPVVPALYGEVMDVGDKVADLTGEDGERIPSMVRANAALTAKSMVIEMLKEEPDVAKIMKAAVEGGPDTSRDVLTQLAENGEYAIEVVGALYLAPAESLDDPKNATLKIDVATYAKGVAARAQYYIGQLDWDAMAKEAAAGRAPASDSGAPEQTDGGDS